MNLGQLENQVNYIYIIALSNIDVETQKKLFYRAMNYGSAAAFLCITKHGAMPSMPK